MALGHKWAKRLKGGEPFVVLFRRDKLNISWAKHKRLKRTMTPAHSLSAKA